MSPPPSVGLHPYSGWWRRPIELVPRRKAIQYQISCFFIKFINGLWPPPPLFYKVTLWIFFDFFIKLRCEFFSTFFRLFPHWIWFLDIQNRFYFIVKRLKNAFLMHFQCLFNCSKTVKTVGIMECLKMAFGWPLPLFWSVQQKKGFFMASLPVTPPVVNFFGGGKIRFESYIIRI